MQNFAARFRNGQGKAREDATQRGTARYGNVSGSRIGVGSLKNERAGRSSLSPATGLNPR
jgi:hypothetical protein